jgi:manganese-dependent inorganic pyrophosphatase
MSLYVVGHKNPDTDSVASAIGYAELLRKRGKDATPVIAGSINKGTALALKKFEVKQPEFAHLIDFPEASVILVDHNEKGQWADGLVKEHVIELIDHHRFGDFSSAQPICVRTQPVGSTAAIITKMFQECNEMPTEGTAGMLLSAILTDTLMFKSPTTTDYDREMAAWLNEIVKIDMKKHAQEIFAAKSDISDMPLRDVINKDFKEFHFNDHAKVGIAMFETVDAAGPLARKDEFITELTKVKNEMGLDYLLFAVVDIIKEVANFIIVSPKEGELLEHVFCGKNVDGIMSIVGLVSRKKQIVPPLEGHFADHNHDHCQTN